MVIHSLRVFVFRRQSGVLWQNMEIKRMESVAYENTLINFKLIYVCLETANLTS